MLGRTESNTDKARKDKWQKEKMKLDKWIQRNKVLVGVYLFLFLGQKRKGRESGSRVLAWQARGPGLDMQHWKKLGVVAQPSHCRSWEVKAREAQVEVILQHTVSLRPA